MIFDLRGCTGGVVPDVPVPAEQAFDTAYRLALESVIGGIGEPASGPLSALLKEAQSALEELGDSDLAAT